MKNEIKNWLVIGKPRNWETALAQPVPIWGLTTRYQTAFQSLNVGDILWFYSTAPITGIIGVGVVKDKYIDEINLIWEDELKQKKVIWPLRFRIHVLKVLPETRWEVDQVKINDFNLSWQTGFQLLKENYAIELSKRSEKTFGIVNREKLFTGTTIAEPLISISTPEKGKLPASHRELQEQIAEIGKLQFYYAEIEYSIDLPGEKKDLDVIWKREINGVPTFAFEVELSSMIEKAIERLKFSFNKWNSRPRIIVPKELFGKVHNILSTSEKDFASQIKIYQPSQISELLRLKRELRTIEQNLALY